MVMFFTIKVAHTTRSYQVYECRHDVHNIEICLGGYKKKLSSYISNWD